MEVAFNSGSGGVSYCEIQGPFLIVLAKGDETVLFEHNALIPAELQNDFRF